MISAIVIALCIPFAVYSLTCHRCFGNNFCNDYLHEDFAGKSRKATCLGVRYWHNDEDPNISDVERSLMKKFQAHFSNISNQNSTLEHHCLTASVFDAYENYTLRTCVSVTIQSNRTNPTLCKLVNEVINPQNVYNGSLSCRACQENFCNNHTLTKGDGLAPNPNSAAQPCSLGLTVLTMVLLTIITKG